MGLLSGLLGGGSKPKVDDGGRADQIKRIDALDIPDEEKMKLILQNPELVGLLEQEEIGRSEMNEIQLDPRLRENQMAALDMLKERSTEGLTAQDKYGMEQMLGGVAAQEQSRQADIEADMARKGMDSSGAALMSKLQSKQSGANTARDRAMQMAAMGQQNKLAALSQLGQQSGKMQGQDFDRQAQMASANDAIARANAMNKMQVGRENLSARQGIEDERARRANEQEKWNRKAGQREFDNQVEKLKLYGGTYTNPKKAPAGPSMGSQLGSVAGGVMGYMKGGPAGAGVGSSAGSAIGGALFEDGGIAHENLPVQMQEQNMDRQYKEAETKQHEAFKKKYMKRIQDEVMGSAEKPKTPEKPEGKADGGLLNEFASPSELPERGGTDFASPDDKNAAVLAALLAESQNMDPSQNIPMRREELMPEYQDGGLIDKKQELGVLERFLDTGRFKDYDPKKDHQRTSDKKNREIIEQIRKGLDETNTELNTYGKYDKSALPITLDSAGELLDIEGTVDNFGGEYKEDKDRRLLDDLGNAYRDRGNYADGGQFYSDGGGDIVDSGMESYAGDRVDAKLNDKEIVVNVPQQQRLMDLLRGKISVDELGTDDIVEGVPREFRDDMHEELEMESEEGMEGIQELLKMLGK